MKFAIGSASNRKIEVAKKIIRSLFNENIEFDNFAAVSGVPDTPYDKQTFDGARNRAINTKENKPGADYYVGLESGLIERYGHIYEEAWTAIIAGSGEEFYGYSSGLKVPDYILKKMNDLKMEHCDVMTILEKEHGKLPNDTWGTYSGGALLREISLEEALRNALIQIAAPKESFYKK